MIKDKFDPDTLMGGGDCLHHYHLSDRFPSRDTMLWLQSLEKVRVITANRTLTEDDDLIVINAASLSIYLPKSRGGRKFVFSILPGGSATIYPNGAELISGLTTMTMGETNVNRVHRLKATTIGWIEI